MSIRYIGQRIESDVTGVSAVFHPELGDDGEGAWVLSAMPNRLLNRDDAVTAMVLADIYARNPPPEAATWDLVRGWREQLGLPVDISLPASGRWGREVWEPYTGQ